TRHNRPRSPSENEERGLERILRVVRIAEHATTDTEHHRPVPADEAGKCVRVALANKRGKQVVIARRIVAGRVAQPLQGQSDSTIHRIASPAHSAYWPPEGRRATDS